MENKDFPETFDLSRFIQDEPFEQIISRFENGRTPDKIPKHKNKVLTVEEFKEETKEIKPNSREQLIKHLEKLEKEIEFEHTN
jgi:hypothetical protein